MPDDLLQPPSRPPYIREADWAHMSRYAQSHAARAYRRDAVERAAYEATHRREEAARTRVYTIREMRAGRRAYETWVKFGRVGDLAPEVRYAWRAYRRWMDTPRHAGQRWTIGSSRKAQEAAALATQGLSLREAAGVLGVQPRSLERTLQRAVTDGGPETLARLREARDARIRGAA